MNDDQLVVIGYACKIFEDDERAVWIDSKSHLLPWNGEKSLMIDRFDVRGLLLDERAFDADYVPAERRGCAPVEDEQLEKLCDQERYRDTTARDSAAVEDRDDHDREWERFQEALQDDGLHAVAYEYEDKEYDPTEPTEDEYPDTITLDEPHLQNNAASAQNVDDKSDSERMENGSSNEPPYVIPRGLIIPHDMNLPGCGKWGVVIEKTAYLVATQGAQMEVLLKTKQSNNPMFDFLNFNSNLHPFYRYILSMIKSRRYTPQPQPKPSSQCNQQPTVSGSQHSSSNIAAVKRQPVASVVIDHSSENESEDDVSTDDSDEDSSGYLHPLLAGATSSTHSPSKCAGEENSTAGLTLQQSKNNKQVGANTNDSSDSSVQESLEEKQKIASMLQICQHNAFKSLCNEQLGQVSVIPPPPDLQMLVDRVAKQVAANAEPTVFEENLRQRQLTEMSGSSSKPMTDGSDIFQCLIDSKSYFLWPADMNHVYYRLKKYFFGECLRTFGCLDPEEEARKKEDAMKGLQTKKAAAVARVKKRPSGPVKFSLSEGAKKLKLKREAAAAASSTKVSSHGNALPYEPSDDSDWEVDEFGGAAAAESILQDDEEERNSQPADDEKMTSMSSCKDKRITERLSDNNKDSDSALRAMTQFLSELEAKHGAGDVKLLDCGRELPASSALAPRAHPSLAADVLDDSDLPMSQYEKALQAERKKKACMFLQRLKESSGLQSTTSHSSKDSVD